MISGKYHSTIGNGPAITIPEPLQSLVENHQIVIKKGFGNNHLVIHAPSAMNEIINKLEKLPKKEAQPLIDQLDASYLEVNHDFQLVVPEDLFTYINKENQLIWVGLGNRAELWNPEAYRERMVDQDQEMKKQLDLIAKYLNKDD